MNIPSRKQLEEMVEAANAEARRRKGDEAERFFINDQGVIDMVNADGSPVEEEDDLDECGVSEGGNSCTALPAFAATMMTGFSMRVCAAHVALIKERFPDAVLKPLVRA